jgi:hypothetical protein
MNSDRRAFFKNIAAAAAVTAIPTAAIARAKKTAPPDAVGLLYGRDALHRLQGLRGRLQRRQQDAG